MKNTLSKQRSPLAASGAAPRVERKESVTDLDALRSKVEQLEAAHQQALGHIFDLLCADDGQAHKEARKHLEKHAPAYVARLHGVPSSAVSPQRDLSDDGLRAAWRAAGGGFHGPTIETGTMPEEQLLPFLRSLASDERPNPDPDHGTAA